MRNEGFAVWIHGMKKTAKSRKAGMLGIIVLLSIMLLALSAVKPVYSANQIDEKEQEIALVLRPLTIIDYSLGPSEEFDVNISALNAAYLHGFQMRLTYDPALVECKTIQEGDLLNVFGNTRTFYTVNNTLGNVYISSNLTSSDAIANGNGTLAELKFQVIGRGETAFKFNDVSLYNSSGTSLPYVTYNGYFNNRFLFDVAMPLT
ncbi:MAG: cohesin domain-containing protein, partial [Candidatus Bathyarchaeia archaeon]